MYDVWKIDDPFTNYSNAISNPTIMSGNKQNFTGKATNDRIAFYANYSTLHANGSNDLIQADSGFYSTLHANGSNDLIQADSGFYSTLYGGIGNDTLYGAKRNYTLTGSAGNDVFIYAAGNDVFTDWTIGTAKATC